MLLVLCKRTRLHPSKQESVIMETNLADGIGRRASPIRRDFIERPSDSDAPTPLSRLLRTQGNLGGKGGGLRVSLLLTLIWVNARPPHSSSRVPSYWARLLRRDDPDGEGARTIRECLHELESRGFITLVQSGQRQEIFLHNEARPERGRQAKNLYRLPYGRDTYVQVPRTFWTEGLAGTLSGAATAMYLVALAMTRHDDPDFFLAGEFFQERFGISRSSKKRGLAELVERDVLNVESVADRDLDTFRMTRRNIYTVKREFLQPEPWIGDAERGANSSNATGSK